MKKSVWVFALAAVMAAFSLAQAQQNGAAKGDQNGLPPEQALNEAPKILGVDMAPASVGEDISYYPYNSSLGYKGVCMANFDYFDANDELLVDFGTLGIWYYNAGVWTQQSGVNPESMVTMEHPGASDAEIAVDFGTLGLWYWNEGSWTQLSGVNPEGMFAVDDDWDGDDELQVDFGSLGVWHLDISGYAWTQISGLNPYYGLRMDAGQYGYEEGCWLFPSVGVWCMYKSNTSDYWYYKQLTGTVNYNDDQVSAHFTNAAQAEDLVMDFDTLGIWLYNQLWGPWVQISSMSPNRLKEVMFVGGTDDELLAENNAGGLYWGNWNGSTFAWTLITNLDIGPGAAWCESFDLDGTDSGDEEVIVPMTAGGAYKFDYSAGSTFSSWIATNYFVNFIVKGDYYNKGRDSTLAVAFNSSSGQPGLWLYEKDANPAGFGWTKISTSIPDGWY